MAEPTTVDEALELWALDNSEAAEQLKALVSYWVFTAPKEIRTGYRNVGRAFAELEV